MSNLFSRGESWELPARGIRPLFAPAINADRLRRHSAEVQGEEPWSPSAEGEIPFP